MYVLVSEKCNIYIKIHGSFCEKLQWIQLYYQKKTFLFVSKRKKLSSLSLSKKHVSDEMSGDL